jgi:tRNA A-37 threonylcarbamoyl transferase component Bud32
MSDMDGKKIGRYHIHHEVGRGGVATVYQARDLDTGSVVAVKILAPYLVSDENIRIRFQREAEVLETLDHPNIVPILDHGEADGYVYLVLPFIDYGTLSDRMRSGPIRPKEGARYISQIASALEYAHHKGIVHRDIKPSNILITDEGEALLSDFGFIQMEDSPQSLTGSAIIGTPAFMAPEQIRGEDVTARSDQYALGVLLYQMSTGELPYDAETPMGVAIKHATDPLPRPRAVNPNLPDAVEAVIIKTLEKEPENRYESVEAFNDAFQDALIASIDPITGQLRPGAVGEDPETAVLHLRDSLAGGRIRFHRRWAVLLLLFLLFACPSTVWAVNEFGLAGAIIDQFGGEDTAGTEVAMVSALSTENAALLGTAGSPQDVAQAVAGTMTSLAVESSEADGAPEGTEENELTQTMEAFDAQQAGTTLPATATVLGTLGTTATLPGSTESVKTPTRTATNPIEQSATPEATSTPTTTPVPPTSTNPPEPTATPDVCDAISLHGFNTHGQEVDWSISNETDAKIKIQEIYINWPGENGALIKIELDGGQIWSGDLYPPPTNITSGMTGGRQIENGQSEMMRFFFGSNASSSGYTLEISFFNNVCSPRQSR